MVPAREKFARLQPGRLPIKTLSNSSSPGDHGGTGGEGRRLIPTSTVHAEHQSTCWMTRTCCRFSDVGITYCSVHIIPLAAAVYCIRGIFILAVRWSMVRRRRFRTLHHCLPARASLHKTPTDCETVTTPCPIAPRNHLLTVLTGRTHPKGLANSSRKVKRSLPLEWREASRCYTVSFT